MRQPCGIRDCPALCLDNSSYCAVHTAMTDEERKAEQENPFCSRPHVLLPVQTRIGYERDK